MQAASYLSRASRPLLARAYRRSYASIPPAPKIEPEGPFIFSRKSWKRGTYVEEGWELAVLSLVVPTGIYFIYAKFKGEPADDDIHSWARQELKARKEVMGDRRVSINLKE